MKKTLLIIAGAALVAATVHVFRSSGSSEPQGKPEFEYSAKITIKR